jgi:signal transduction histidine kinase
MRALILELRPEALESEGLVAVLRKQTAALQAQHGVEVRTMIEQEPTVSREIKHALYRVVQEALQNVIKHAHATRVELKLRQSDHSLTLEIKDNGTGFDTSQPFPGHLGLQSMQERITRFGGTFQVESQPSAGTHIHVEIALDANSDLS